MTALPRFSTLITRWVMATAMVCVLLAWPLHEARHASEPIIGSGQASGAVSAVAVLAVDAIGGAGESGGNDNNDNNGTDSIDDGATHVVKRCVWCMFHGENYLDVGVPPTLTFHAEVSRPPSAVPCGRPMGRCPLAAEPRGPPQA